MSIILLLLFVQSSNDYYLCRVLEGQSMQIDDEGLKDRVELLQYLRFLLRNEESILFDWCSESDFYEEVFKTVKELAENLQRDE